MPRGCILIVVRGGLSLRTLGAEKRSGKCAKPASIIIKILIFVSFTKAPLKCIHLSSLLFFTTKFLAKCKTSSWRGLCGDGPLADVRTPISAVLAAKRLDQLLDPFSSLPWSKHMNLTYPHSIFLSIMLLHVSKKLFPQKGPVWRFPV